MELYEALNDLVISTKYFSEGAFNIQKFDISYIQFILGLGKEFLVIEKRY